MTRKKMLPLSILLPIVLSVLSVNMIGVSAVVSPYIEVFPASIVDTGYGLGTNFTVSIRTDYVGTSEYMDYIWGYQFALSYNPSVINGVEVVNGDLIVGGSANFLPGPFDNVAGELSLTVGVFEEGGEVTSGTGSSILANVKFTVVGYGASDINIDSAPLERQSKLVGWNWLLYPYCDYDIINAAEHPDQIQHGYFQNVADLTHDVAVTSVTPASTTVLVDTSLDITVDVTNEGNVNEAFDVTAYANATPIETQTLTNLGSGLTKSLTFTWDTTGVPLGPYTISATASTVPDETDTEDNTDVSAQPVTVTGPMYIPVANITILSEDLDYYINETAIFSGALSYDPDGGTIVTYEWDFDDGTYATSDYPIVEHEWTTIGYYDVSLVVTDISDQVSDPYIVTIKIEEDPVIPPDYYADLIKWKAKAETRSWDESNDPGTEKEDIWTGDNATTSFITTYKPIVENSEEVYVNQTLTTDYTIDYETGNITFTTAPDDGVEIKATYLWVTKTVTLTALASNMGLNPVNVKVSYTIIDYQTGLDAGPVITENRTLDADGLQVEITTDFDPDDYGYNGEKLDLTVEVTLTYDSTGDGTPDTEGSTKKFRLTVKP